MAEAETGLGAWRPRICRLVQPAVRWRDDRPWLLLAAAVVFVLVGFVIPQRFAAPLPPNVLEIGEEINALKAQIETLKEERILDEAKACELTQKLDELRNEASGRDPVKTWEALDHLKEVPERAAAEAAEEAIQDTEKLTKAEALADALTEAGEAISPELATAAMEELSEMVDEAAQENELVKRRLERKDLQKLAESKQLTSEQLEELAQCLREAKGDIAQQLQKLADKGLITAEQLDLNSQVGQCDMQGLADFLRENAGNTSIGDMMDQWARSQGCDGFGPDGTEPGGGTEGGSGGVSRGPGPAPLTWKDETGEEGFEYDPQVLPPSDLAALKSSMLEAVSKGAPRAGAGESSTPGALEGAAATPGRGSAHTETVLPRHRGTVRRYFARD
ncbi:MAG: hypothetical protein JW889_10690 [Verrucomicrobia bacterium]|nr:hypothetical protein [Verrucomicrobiota bacterium]